ncbi:aminotransferase class V-fold PLP-dependent enzyme [Curtobacterium sp. MCBD17_040]|uniref:kynureninase n=1 Tax=Curtobacterium sp. MCBD17_040 TaxID=2175674 RepID=UPI000DA9A419|nr:aminotransferase class V-fold PLP-dependent enzyme [Curtobacterium sp. MCBD17_040]WIB63197.1 aminotransferase class V-fold PLP-dependent enzyme [Curtobacterium sp. MCBD17_040]
MTDQTSVADDRVGSDAPRATTPDSLELDRTDPLAEHVAAFVPSTEVRAYLDGNSLGRPLLATAERLQRFVTHDWGSRLIRSWDEQWMTLPLELGDRIGAVCLGAAAEQTVVADSTTVLLYKTIRAAVAARPDRTEIVIDDDDFPTDRFVVEGIAAECGLSVRWIAADPVTGVAVEQVEEAVSTSTAVVVLSHVAYRSGVIADVPGITAAAHAVGALVLWDLCHSAGVVPTSLDAWDVDLAVGCTYKFLNGGPGSPAFAYAAERLQADLRQPIQGWMGAADVFSMADGYTPSPGMRRLVSGTPPVVGMLAMQDMLDLLERVGIDAVRAKSVALTEHAIALVDDLLAPFGVVVSSPRDADVRGSHVTITHPAFREVTAALWAQDVIPDHRNPNGIRLGLSPLSTTFAEVRLAVEAIRAELAWR